MRIYYKECNDQELLSWYSEQKNKDEFIGILRGAGCKNNIEYVKNLFATENQVNILTNDEELIETSLCWNEETRKHDLYFIVNDKPILAQDLTDRELRYPHNLRKMYLAGEFID